MKLVIQTPCLNEQDMLPRTLAARRPDPMNRRLLEELFVNTRLQRLDGNGPERKLP